MSTLQKSLLSLLLCALGVMASGCSTQSPKQSSIPWSQPAGWEGQIPGMGAQKGR